MGLKVRLIDWQSPKKVFLKLFWVVALVAVTLIFYNVTLFHGVLSYLVVSLIKVYFWRKSNSGSLGHNRDFIFQKFILFYLVFHFFWIGKNWYFIIISLFSVNNLSPIFLNEVTVILNGHAFLCPLLFFEFLLL